MEDGLDKGRAVVLHLAAEGGDDAGAVLAASVDDGPAAAVLVAVAVSVGMAVAIAAGHCAYGRAHVNLAALAQVQLLLEVGDGLPGDGAVPVAGGADGAADADDVGVDAGQLVQVFQLEMAAEGGAQAGRLGLQHHIAQDGFGHKVEQVAPVLGEGVDEEAIALAVFGQLHHQVRVKAAFKEEVIGEEGADELGVGVADGGAGLAEHFNGGVVVGNLEADLD